jgi:ribonuclease VapC
VVVDSSAICAILFDEPEAEQFMRIVSGGERCLIGAVSALETAVVVESKKGDAGGRELDLLFYKLEADIVPMDAGQYHLARAAWQKYGKGRHPAGLNLGDCCSYALSQYTGEPLLFKGDDFPKTDIIPAPQSG